MERNQQTVNAKTHIFSVFFFLIHFCLLACLNNHSVRLGIENNTDYYTIVLNIFIFISCNNNDNNDNFVYSHDYLFILYIDIEIMNK